MICLKFDGLFNEFEDIQAPSKNAGFLCYGWVIFWDGRLIARGHGGAARGLDATSNVAEYLALIEGLDALADLNLYDEPVEVWGDAKCVIDQMRGASAVHSPTILPLYQRARRLAEDYRQIEWFWTPRRNNKDADLLTRHALRQIYSNKASYRTAMHVFDGRQLSHSTGRKFLHLCDLRVYLPHNRPETVQLS